MGNADVGVLQFFRWDVAGPENGVSSVVQAPIAVQQAALRFHLLEQGCGWVRCEDVKGRAFEAVLFNQFRSASKNGFSVVVEPQNKRAIYLDTVVVKQADTPGVIGSLRSLFSGVGEIVVGERFETHENATAAGGRHLANESGVVRNIDRHGYAPYLIERQESLAERSQVVPARTEIVVDEYGIGLFVGFELVCD